MHNCCCCCYCCCCCRCRRCCSTIQSALEPSQMFGPMLMCATCETQRTTHAECSTLIAPSHCTASIYIEFSIHPSLPQSSHRFLLAAFAPGLFFSEYFSLLRFKKKRERERKRENSWPLFYGDRFSRNNGVILFAQDLNEAAAASTSPILSISIGSSD